MWIVNRQPFTPYLLKSEVAHHKIEPTIPHLHHHRRGRLVGFRTGSGRHERIDSKGVTHNLFKKKTLRFNGDGKYRLLSGTLFFVRFLTCEKQYGK